MAYASNMTDINQAKGYDISVKGNQCTG